MDPCLTRRDSIKLLAALPAAVASVASRGQTPGGWQLQASVLVLASGYVLKVHYEAFDAAPLYLHILDREEEGRYLFETRLIASVGDVQVPIGLWDLADGRPYRITIVTADGVPHPLSPVVEIDVPGYPAHAHD